MNFDEIVSWTETILGFGLKASPIVLFYQIAVGNKKIEIVPEMLIICNVLSAELWFSYWIRIKTKMAPIVSSSVSFVLGVIFSIIYLFYFSQKKCSKLFIYVIMECVAIALLYYTLSLTEIKIVGFIANCVNILNFISPAQRIVRVCREKNYSLIPIATTVLGCISSFLWLVFGILINDYNVMIPNTISVLIALFNTLIWFYFYCTTKEKKEKPKENEEEMIETNRGDEEEMKEI
jgi:uncharacterized protein with PQ loop repeat